MAPAYEKGGKPYDHSQHGRRQRKDGEHDHDRRRHADLFQGKNALECIKAYSETDFTEDLKKFDAPTLIVHGDDDQIVPIVAAAHRSSELVENATLKVYEGAPHGLPVTHKDQLNHDLLAFIEG